MNARLRTARWQFVWTNLAGKKSKRLSIRFKTKRRPLTWSFTIGRYRASS